MASPVDICNLALGHIGDRANVQDIDTPESTVQGEKCAIFYPIARDELLEYGWDFNTRRITLALLEEEPTPSWAFSYAMPAGCIKPVSVLLPGATDDTDSEDFVVETISGGGQVIYTSAEDATLRFIARVTDTTKWSPMFVTALSWLLASYLAGPIIKGRTGAQVAVAARRQFNDTFRMAHASNANASRKKATYKTYKAPWIADR